jgi:shikimate kinase
LLSPEAEAILRSHAALVIYLDCPLADIRRRVGQGEGRPLISDRDTDHIRQLYETRKPHYERLADFTVDAGKDPSKITAAILAGLGFGGETV